MRIERIERRDDGRIGQMIGGFFFDGDAEKGKEYYRAFRTVRDKSVKLVDDGEIVGIMLTADDGIELFNGGKEPDVNAVLHKYSGIMASVLGLEPEYRGKGYGKATFRKLASIAKERGCGRVEWWCLDWNKPSIDFYLSLGAEPMNDWTVFRLSGDTLESLAE
jgi:GNAT superfamily N-acetyltransferase